MLLDLCMFWFNCRLDCSNLITIKTTCHTVACFVLDERGIDLKISSIKHPHSVKMMQNVWDRKRERTGLHTKLCPKTRLVVESPVTHRDTFLPFLAVGGYSQLITLFWLHLQRQLYHLSCKEARGECLEPTEHCGPEIWRRAWSTSPRLGSLLKYIRSLQRSGYHIQ